MKGNPLTRPCTGGQPQADSESLTEGKPMMSRLMSCAAALMLLVVAAPAAAQRSVSDHDLLYRRDGYGLSNEDRKRFDELKEGEAKDAAEDQALRQRLLRLPSLPDERNVLLGSWRVEESQGGGAAGLGQGKGSGGTDAMFRELWATLQSNPDKLLCVPMFGKGITFASSTYAIQGLDGSVFRGPVDYRSTAKQVIVALPRNWKILSFEVAGPNRILFTKSCALVRVGAPEANAPANVPNAPGNARTAAAPARSAAPMATAADGPGAVVDGAAFRCADGSLLHVSFCQGDTAQATCKLSELHLPGLQMGRLVPRADIATRVRTCEAGGIRYGADDKPVFIR